jgi:hypothetical protein
MQIGERGEATASGNRRASVRCTECGELEPQGELCLSSVLLQLPAVAGAVQRTAQQSVVRNAVHSTVQYTADTFHEPHCIQLR